ncbi:MAG: BRO family protein [Saprospiraceae bacterium]|nr:BRO family protein [Saprospiraceae bacterium]
MEKDQALIPLSIDKIRKVQYEEQWYFNVSDVIAILTDSKDPKAYWRNLKKRLLQESGNQSVSNCYGLKFEANDGKKYTQDAANTEGILRIIMSVPSPKAEPLKLWLAEQGKQALDEAENPELLTERQAELYRAKGYTEEWIGRRVQTIETRKALTDEWKERGIKENQEYAILTATTAKGTFGLTPSEHKELKGLDRQNLRDHMTPLELIFTALSEEATKMIAIREDAQGFSENHHAATEGGRMAGDARENFEKNMNESVISGQNYLKLGQNDKPEELPK